MIFDKIIARVTILTALCSSSLAFLLHAGCRTTNYQLDVFNRFCYSDLAVYVQEGVVPFSDNSPAVAPLSHVLLWFIGFLPNFELKMIILQLVITLAFVLCALSFQIWRGSNTYDGVLFAILPLTLLTMFIGFDIVAIAVSMPAILMLKRRPDSFMPWILFAVAIGFDGWAWIVVAATIVHMFIEDRLGDVLYKLPVFVATLGVINIPIALTTRDFFAITPTFSDGTGLYALSQISGFNPPTNFIPYFFGFGLLVAFTVWLKFSRTRNRIRFEIVLLLFLATQTLTTNVIGPSEVMHLVWALLLAYPLRNFVVSVSVVFTFWTAAVWLYAETLVGQRGLDVSWYVIATVVMWTAVIWCGIKAAEIIHTPGKDPVLNGQV